MVSVRKEDLLWRTAAKKVQENGVGNNRRQLLFELWVVREGKLYEKSSSS